MTPALGIYRQGGKALHPSVLACCSLRRLRLDGYHVSAVPASFTGLPGRTELSLDEITFQCRTDLEMLISTSSSARASGSST